MFSKQDEGAMRLALGQAENALRQNWIPIGAVFMSGSHVVAYGVKDGTKHPRFDHAEHNGCYQALWAGCGGPRDLRDITVYSTLEPCLMCLSMLMTTRVKRIVYAMEDLFGGGEFMLKHPDILPSRYQNERPVIEGGCLREASRQLLKQFFQTQLQGDHQSWSDMSNLLVKACLEWVVEISLMPTRSAGLYCFNPHLVQFFEIPRRYVVGVVHQRRDQNLNGE